MIFFFINICHYIIFLLIFLLILTSINMDYYLNGSIWMLAYSL